MNTRLRKNLTGSMSFYSHIPALDGGHVFFLLYEMITGRKPGDKFLTYAEYAGFTILLLLLVVANLNDVLRLFGII
jgi:regulator of sigma E protease